MTEGYLWNGGDALSYTMDRIDAAFNKTEGILSIHNTFVYFL